MITGWTLAVMVALGGQFGQTKSGELRLTVVDAAGLPLESSVELISEANQFREHLSTNPDGVLVAKRLPFGSYRVIVGRDGFATFTGTIDIRSALPTEYRVTLGVAPIQTQVTVGTDDTLIDAHQTATIHRIGLDAFQRRPTALPGRALQDVVTTQPGWLLEANGILHPRGSEYQTQFVVDGLPLTDNRSPAFSPEIGAEDVHALSILTGGYPAEYGRKLGGVIEVTTAGEAREGLHVSATVSGGSFDTKAGDAIAEYGWRHSTLTVAGGLAYTQRYLDPPVEQNYTNQGNTAHVAARLERDLTDTDRIGVIVRAGSARFLVPNEQVQQDAGQRQERDSREAVGQFSYQRIVSNRLVADVRAMARNLSASMWSNEHATPINAEQNRQIRELYLKAALAGHAGGHEWKIGGDVDAASVREHFAYELTDPSRFDPTTPRSFRFDGRRTDSELALFGQDQIRLGPWTVDAGLRWDHYAFVVDEDALSPRLGIAWTPAANLVLRASYDRAFQTPSIENLLLASSPAVETLSRSALRLPVRPSLGNFLEGGFSKAFSGRFRLDGTVFARSMANFADDDLLLNTGVSFPIAFRRATIRGAELALSAVQWRGFSGSISYAHLHGTAELPVTGGLFLGDDVGDLTATGTFPVSQDQRHTIRARASYQIAPAAWIGIAGAYGSGLPFEFNGDVDEALQLYGQRIVDRVDFETGRVGPSLTFDASAGVILFNRSTRSARLQVDVRNLTDRLNVINFAGLFSGTALAMPRSVSVRLRVDF